MQVMTLPAELPVLEKIEERHYVDGAGHPAGGLTFLTGARIIWQDGPLDPELENFKGEGDAKIGAGRPNRGRNGAFVEDVILAAIGRLKFFQASQFHCRENQTALLHLGRALEALNTRTMRRKKQRVEGKYEKHVENDRADGSVTARA